MVGEINNIFMYSCRRRANDGFCPYDVIIRILLRFLWVCFLLKNILREWKWKDDIQTYFYLYVVTEVFMLSLNSKYLLGNCVLADNRSSLPLDSLSGYSLRYNLCITCFFLCIYTYTTLYSFLPLHLPLKCPRPTRYRSKSGCSRVMQDSCPLKLLRWPATAYWRTLRSPLEHDSSRFTLPSKSGRSVCSKR